MNLAVTVYDSNMNVIPSQLGMLTVLSLSLSLFRRTHSPSYNSIALIITFIHFCKLFIPIIPSVLVDSNQDSAVLNTLTFFASAPALGFDTYLLSVSAAPHGSATTSMKLTATSSDVILVGSDVLVTVSAATGRLASVSNTQAGVGLSIDQVLLWYNASSFGDASSPQASGKYVCCVYCCVLCACQRDNLCENTLCTDTLTAWLIFHVF